MNTNQIMSEMDFVKYAIENHTIINEDRMYPYIVFQYKVPNIYTCPTHDLEICMRHSILRDRRLHCPSLRIVHSPNCDLMTDNGHRDYGLRRCTRKLLHPNRVTKFKINMKSDEVAYLGFFGEGVNYIDYISMISNMTIKSEHIGKCKELENLIISPTSSIEKFDMQDIPKNIKYLKIYEDMDSAVNGNIETLITRKYLYSLYLVGYGYTGDVKKLISMSNIKNANIIAANATGFDTIKKSDFPTALKFDSGDFWVNIMKR